MCRIFTSLASPLVFRVQVNFPIEIGTVVAGRYRIVDFLGQVIIYVCICVCIYIYSYLFGTVVAGRYRIVDYLGKVIIYVCICICITYLFGTYLGQVFIYVSICICIYIYTYLFGTVVAGRYRIVDYLGQVIIYVYIYVYVCIYILIYLELSSLGATGLWTIPAR